MAPPVVPVRVVGPDPLGSVPSDGVPSDGELPDDKRPEVGVPDVGVLAVVVGLGVVAETEDAIEVGEFDGSKSPWLISTRSSAQAARSNKGKRT